MPLTQIFLHSPEEQWRQTIDFCLRTLGKPSILVNNAGIVRSSPIPELTIEDYLHHVNINQVSVFLGMKTIYPLMKELESGSIINISSVCGLIGAPNQLAYTATKFAVRGMSKVAAIEFGKYGIRVNSVHPGAVATSIQNNVKGTADFVSQLPIQRLAEPKEIANLVTFLASDESSYCTGSEFIMDGGWTAQ